MTHEVVVEVYDATLTRTLSVAQGFALAATRNHHGPDQIELTAQSPALVRHLRAPETSIRVMVDGVEFASGLLRSLGGGMGEGQELKGVFAGHWAWLTQVIVWPDQTKPIKQQPDFYLASGPAETVISNLVTSQVNQLGGHQITSTATQARGPQVSISSRFEPVSEAVEHLLSESGLVWRLTHTPPGGLVLSARTPAQVKPIIEHDSSALTGEGEWFWIAPTATRAVIGGSGSGAPRKIDLATHEETTGWRREVFIDEIDYDSAVDMLAAGTRKLHGMAATGGVRGVRLVEAGHWGWGRSHDVGDVLTIRTSWGQEVQATARAVDLTVDADGITLITHLGDWAGLPWMRDVIRQHRISASVRAMEAR